MSGPLIIQAELVVNTKFALVGSTARVQRLPIQVVATFNNWAEQGTLVGLALRCEQHTATLRTRIIIKP